MSITLPSDILDYVQQAVATGVHHDEAAVLAEGVRLLQRRDHFRQQAKLGVEQLDRGEFTEYDDAGISKRLEEIKAEGRERNSRTEGGA